MSERFSFTDYKLPPGRHGIPAAEVAANQRWRLVGAAAEEFAENGRIATTSTSVSRRAGVSPATFYKYFDDISDCLLAAYEMSAAALMEAVEAGCRESQLPWRRRLQDSLRSALRFLMAEPAIAAMLGAGPPASEPAIAEARDELVDRLAGMLAAGGDSGRGPMFSAAGVLMLVSDCVQRGDAKRLPGLAPELDELLGAVAGGEGDDHSNVARSGKRGSPSSGTGDQDGA